MCYFYRRSAQYLAVEMFLAGYQEADVGDAVKTLQMLTMAKKVRVKSERGLFLHLPRRRLVYYE